MLATTVRLHDIRDIEGFVAAQVERSGLRPHLSECEHEELIAEGITILYDLEKRYEPQRAGYAKEGRFSGFASQFLPRRLGDAWHASHAGHRRLTAPDGSRTWSYEPAPISIDTDEPPIIVAPEMSTDLHEEMPRIRAAIGRMQPWQQLGMRQMVDLLLDGYGWDEIGNQLNVSREQLTTMREQLASGMAEMATA